MESAKTNAAKILGSMGGKSTYKKRGKKYMAEIGRKGRAKQLALKESSK